jgi:hypothetical protein
MRSNRESIRSISSRVRFCIAAGCATILAWAAIAHAYEVDALAGVRPSDTTLSLLQEPAVAAAPEGGDDWRLSLTGWVWLVGADGEVGARGLTADVSANFLDVLDATDSVYKFSGRLEIAKGRWGGFIDGTYIRLGADNQSGPLPNASVDVRTESLVIDFALTYRVGEWEPGGEAGRNRQNTTLDLYAGGRYSHIELELRPANFPRVSRSHDWLDPIVGARFTLPLSRHWHTLISGDVGGFGVESDFTWSGTAVLGYDFTLFNTDTTFYAGYRAIGWDYSQGSGANRFIFDVIQHGPIIGLSLSF